MIPNNWKSIEAIWKANQMKSVEVQIKDSGRIVTIYKSLGTILVGVDKSTNEVLKYHWLTEARLNMTMQQIKYIPFYGFAQRNPDVIDVKYFETELAAKEYFGSNYIDQHPKLPLLPIDFGVAKST